VLSAFIAAGERPIAVTPGSAMAHGEAFITRALDAAHALGRRVVLVTPFADELPSTLPTWVHHVPYAPYRALLPAVSLMIHHGGIGTSARCLAAGIPQLVVPFAHDQFDNGLRLQRLGVARTLRAAAPLTHWVTTLRELSESSASIEAVRRGAERMADDDGAATIAAQLEALGPARP
jgi:rhamnosyltransferase subunit B